MFKYLVILPILFLSHFIDAADIDVFTTQDGAVMMILEGELNYNDQQKFVYIAESWRESGNPIQTILLSSSGGNVRAAEVISRYILNYNIKTIVIPYAHCYSACFNIFIAGSPRFAYEESSIGVHRISFSGRDTDSARSSSIDMNSYYKAMNVPDNIRLAMLETPPSELYYLSN